MHQSITRNIQVQVKSEYVPERSDPQHQFYFFVYHISIANEGAETVQLISRHWVITDGNGDVEEVKGPGVVGKQPVLEPGDNFEYTSACPLKTPMGSMQGTYQMKLDNDVVFDVEIPEFKLEPTYTLH